MHIVILLIFILLLLVGPQFWAQWVLRRHSRPRDDFPGSGSEFAQHLINRIPLDGVNVEQTELGDHYDPTSKTIRLSRDNMQNRSLTAIVVAAHETGHAIQHFSQYGPFRWRSRLVVFAQYAEKIGAGLMLAIPVVSLLLRTPVAGGVFLLLGVMTMLSVVLVHLVTLPVELDASFGRALPILKAGNYINEQDMVAAKKVLRACAFTYVAQSLASLVNLWRWIKILRR